MDQIAYNLGYEPRQPDLAELHTEINRLNSEMERILEEIDRVSEQIRRHPEHQAQSAKPGFDPEGNTSDTEVPTQPDTPDSDPETSRGAPTNSNRNDYRMRNAPQTGPGGTQNR
jgi:hypothetical protein